MTFEEQLDNVITELNPSKAKKLSLDGYIENISSYGKHLVLEAWKVYNDPILFTRNTFNDTFGLYMGYYFHKEMQDSDWNAKEKQQNKLMLQSLKDLLLKKNADYGSSFAKVAQQLGAIPTFSVRILDKCNRLDQLLEDQRKNKHRQVEDESILDTMLDLLGYYILCIITMKYYVTPSK